ncbi:MAG: family 20 glycosylhydrolase [Bacteroidales bacterium]|nr:family 20 glycosylhydrolase [Bacteroidales bacterium]
MTRILSFLLLTFVLATGCSDRQTQKEPPDIIPRPANMTVKKGSFRISPQTTIWISIAGTHMEMVAEGLSQTLSRLTGEEIPVGLLDGKPPKNSVLLAIDNTIARDFGQEGYILSVTPSNIIITAAEPMGLFYGIQTIYQLMPVEIFSQEQDLVKGNLTIPCVEITDLPTFSWRGMHLDVSRHFFPKEFIKKYIDLIALHKMNVFHWHLTDDNGWRIEIKKYPLLTEVAAWRADREGISWNKRAPARLDEPATYGGFYTQDDIREIVQYAAERFITVVPEIEMPGHTSEVFSAYPEFSCSGKRIPVQTGGYWPNTDIFCAGKDETFNFLEDVLDEVLQLFPSPFIHIGGDEADKTNWKTCRECQARMKNEGLGNADELQSYFIKRIGLYLESKGRRLIGWDEIMEGGLPRGAVVMSWRGFEGGIEAAQKGHMVVMCPTSHCYFDYYQADPDFQPEAIGGLTTLRKVYDFRPAPEELNQFQARNILGAQGNVWTEYIATSTHAEYMALPRMTALAEVLWTPQHLLNWQDFRERLQTQFQRFDHMGVNYFPGSGKVEINTLTDPDNKAFSFTLEAEAYDTEIFYTLDGKEPGKNSFPYTKPVNIQHNATLKAIAYKNGKALEKPAVYELNYHGGLGLPITYRSRYSQRYPAKGAHSLFDGLKGSLRHNDGFWQGYHGNNMDVVIRIDQAFDINSVSTTFLQDQGKWIFYPSQVNYYFSEDGVSFKGIGGVKRKPLTPDDIVMSNDYTIRLQRPLKVNYLRIEAINIGVCPDWHPGNGGKAWIFADEIIINQ